MSQPSRMPLVIYLGTLFLYTFISVLFVFHAMHVLYKLGL